MGIPAVKRYCYGPFGERLSVFEVAPNFIHRYDVEVLGQVPDLALEFVRLDGDLERIVAERRDAVVLEN